MTRKRCKENLNFLVTETRAECTKVGKILILLINGQIEPRRRKVERMGIVNNTLFFNSVESSLCIGILARNLKFSKVENTRNNISEYDEVKLDSLNKIRKQHW